MKRRDLLKKSIPLAAAVPVSGCAYLQPFLGEIAKDLAKNIRVSIERMNVQQMSLGALDMLFDVKLLNRNPVGLKLAGLDWDLGVGRQSVVTGKSTKGVTIPKKGSAVSQFAVNLPFLNIASSVLDVLQKGKIDYNIASNFLIGNRQQKFKVPVAFAGSTPLPKPPQLGVKNFAFTSVGAGGIGGELLMSAMNPNGFNIPVDKFLATLKLNGHEVLTNKVLNGSQIMASKTSDVPVAFNLGLGQLGLSIASLLQKPKIDWEVDLSMITAGIPFPFKTGGQVPLSLGNFSL